MKLLPYLQAKRGRAALIAAKTGLAPQTLSQLAHGKQRPSVETIDAIAKATAGECRCCDWFPLAKVRK